MRGLLRTFGFASRTPRPRYDISAPIPFEADSTSFGRADAYGGFDVFDARLPNNIVSSAYGCDDLDFTWEDVCTFIEAAEEHAHLDAEQRAVAVVYFSCIGSDTFPVDILIDREKIRTNAQGT